MSDELQNAATIASLRAEVERLNAELDESKREHGWVSDLVAVITKDNNATFDGINAALDAAGITFLDEDTYAECIGRLASERDDRNAYAERLLAENVRLSKDAATARERAGVLEAEVRAWRYRLVQGETVGGDQDGADCRLNAAMAETDRTKALYANEFGGAT